MKLIYFLLYGLLVLPTLVAASPVSTCISGTVQKDTFYKKDSIQSWMPRVVTSRAATCSDELVYISVGLGATVTVCSTRQCKAGDEQRYGCKPGLTQPIVVFATSDGKLPIKISKCHGANAIAQALSKTVEHESPDALLALSTPPGFTAQAQPSIPQSSAASQQLSSVLSGGFDATRPEERQKAAQVLIDAGVAPADANEAIKRIASGDAEGAKKIVQADLNLSPDVLNKAVTTGGDSDPKPDAAAADPNAQQYLRPQGYTGFSPEQTARSQDRQANPFSAFGGAGMASPFGIGNQFAKTTPVATPFFSSAPLPLPTSVTSADMNPSLRAVATIFAQPRSVALGNSILVSWASVGMKTDSCVVSKDDVLLAKKNEGARVVKTGIAATAGEITFTLSCSDISGKIVERSAVVTVR